jgi:hypothetical protein
MNLEQHIDIIRALPIKYKSQLLKLFFEVLEDHFASDGTIVDGNTRMSIKEFIRRCSFQVPVTRAVQPIGKNPYESQKNMRTNNQSTSPRRIQIPTQR